MSLLPVRPASLCLFCASAARLRPRPPRLLPRIPIAHRSSIKKKPSRPNGNAFNRSTPPQLRAPSLGIQRPFNALGQVRDRMAALRKELAHPAFLKSLRLDPNSFDREWLTFERSISLWIKQATPELLKLAEQDARGKDTLGARLRYLFYAQTFGGRFTAAELENQKEVADLRYPSEWYPATRQIPRTVHLHVGPTNSGKTYHALKRLEEASTGIYLGPLRLLAHEVYTRLNAKGKPCALVTGEEQRMPARTASMFSCTVEMAPLNSFFDVAVIDEIQMINHPDRGWAWTQAFLGLQAREIHLCGEARTVPLMRELCALVGDKVHVHEYQRLTPLQVQPKSLNGKLEGLEKGDCIVAFTVLGIHALRAAVEKKTGRKCAIVYGSLPPETRAQQARLFNDPDNDYDFLVASDAIGMGLNLAIKRVIFESTVKNNGVNFVPLLTSEIKQIAGRAGRYKTAHQAVTDDSAQESITENPVNPAVGLDDNKPASGKEEEDKIVGWVTTLDRIDHPALQAGMNREPEPIQTAGLFPPSLIVERFANYFPPGTPFSYIMLRLHEISEIHPRFHLCALKDQLAIADNIHMVKNLSIQDRIVISAAPINMRDRGEQDFLREMAECIADEKSGSLLDMKHIPLHVLDAPVSSERKYLWSLENLHKMIVCYLWLSYRFPHVFTTRKVANYTKKLIEDQIEKTLTDYSFMQKLNAARKRDARRDLAQRSAASKERHISAPPGMGEEAEVIVNDKQAFREPAPRVDDVDVYPDDFKEGESLGAGGKGVSRRPSKFPKHVGELMGTEPHTRSASAAARH